MGPMTWLIISMPIMLLAIAIAVLPVLLMSVSEARRGFELTAEVAPASTAALAVNTIDNGGVLVEKAA